MFMVFAAALGPPLVEAQAISDLLAVPTAEQIIAAAGSEKNAATVVGTAIGQDAVRRFGLPLQAQYIVSLLDVQWRDQWIPKAGVYNAKDGRRVTFVRLSPTEAAATYQRCGRVLVLWPIEVTAETLTLQVVDQGRCSSSGLQLTFRRRGGQLQPDGEPKTIGNEIPQCGCQ